MFIARQLKETNIAEYLLYMWQVEDLIRANGLDIEQIRSSIVSNYEDTGQIRQELVRWYEELIEMMRAEGVAGEGHLQINENVLICLDELHESLLHSPRFPFYHAAYYKILPYIRELNATSGKSDPSGLRTCFEMLYGVMLLKIQKKEIGSATAKAVTDITRLLSLLAGYDLKNKKGELKLED